MSAARRQDLQQARSRIVTLVIRHQPLAGQQDAYQRWLQRAVTAAREACGHLGVDVIPPAEAGATFTTLVRFADVERLQAWLASPERQALIAEVLCPLLIALGWATRLACLPILGLLLIALLVVHPEWSLEQGQFGWLLLVLFGTLALTGPGRYSLEARLARRHAAQGGFARALS